MLTELEVSIVRLKDKEDSMNEVVRQGISIEELRVRESPKTRWKS